MTKPYRIGVVGLTHDHVWGNLENLAILDSGQLSAVADPKPAVTRPGVPRIRLRDLSRLPGNG